MNINKCFKSSLPLNRVISRLATCSYRLCILFILQLIPLFAVVGAGCVGAAGYIARLALKNPDCTCVSYSFCQCMGNCWTVPKGEGWGALIWMLIVLSRILVSLRVCWAKGRVWRFFFGVVDLQNGINKKKLWKFRMVFLWCLKGLVNTPKGLFLGFNWEFPMNNVLHSNT